MARRLDINDELKRQFLETKRIELRTSAEPMTLRELRATCIEPMSRRIFSEEKFVWKMKMLADLGRGGADNLGWQLMQRIDLADQIWSGPGPQAISLWIDPRFERRLRPDGLEYEWRLVTTLISKSTKKRDELVFVVREMGLLPEEYRVFKMHGRGGGRLPCPLTLDTTVAELTAQATPTAALTDRQYFHPLWPGEARLFRGVRPVLFRGTARWVEDWERTAMWEWRTETGSPFIRPDPFKHLKTEPNGGQR